MSHPSPGPIAFANTPSTTEAVKQLIDELLHRIDEAQRTGLTKMQTFYREERTNYLTRKDIQMLCAGRYEFGLRRIRSTSFYENEINR